MWDRLKECPVLDQLLPAPMWWKMSTGVKTLSREDLSWTSDSQIAKTSHLTIEGMSSGHCPVGAAAAGVGKRPRKSKLLHASYLSTVQPLLSTALLLSTVLPSVRVCARGFRRCCSSSPTPASPPLVLRTPATKSPPAIKPFPTTVGSSVTKTAPANIVRTPSTMAVLILLGELSPTCSVIKIPHMEVPGKCQLQLLRCGRMYEKWHDMKSGNNGSRRQLRETRQTKLSDQKNNKNSQKIIAKKPTWRWKKWSCFHTVCSTDWIPLGLLVL